MKYELIIAAVSFVLGIAVFPLAKRAVQNSVEKFVRTRIDRAVSLAIGDERDRTDRAISDACAVVMANIPHAMENLLAPKRNLADNKPDAPPLASEADKEPPFWQNRDKLEAAKASLETGGTAASLPDLAGLTDMEAWRDVDAALLEYNEATQTPEA